MMDKWIQIPTIDTDASKSGINSFFINKNGFIKTLYDWPMDLSIDENYWFPLIQN